MTVLLTLTSLSYIVTRVSSFVCFQEKINYDSHRNVLFEPFCKYVRTDRDYRSSEECCNNGGEGWFNRQIHDTNAQAFQCNVCPPPKVFPSGELGLPVDGGWSQWAPMSRCSSICGAGHLMEHRSCNQPAPMYGGHNCKGVSRRKAHCFSQRTCPTTTRRYVLKIDGAWSSWSRWSSCSVSCGTGQKVKTRTCSKPSPAKGGRDCDGSTIKVKTCDRRSCALYAKEEWKPLTECPVDTCDTSSQVMITYVCGTCQPPRTKKVSCQKEMKCTAPDGGFWSDWLGEGCLNCQRRFTRECLNGACEGPTEKMEECKQLGQWGKYSSVQGCQPSGGVCGDGTNTYTRDCIGGCCESMGEPSYSEKCEKECPVDGGWTDWSKWGPPCNDCWGTQYRHRSCTSPTPRAGGRNCPSSDNGQGVSNIREMAGRSCSSWMTCKGYTNGKKVSNAPYDVIDLSPEENEVDSQKGSFTGCSNRWLATLTPFFLLHYLL